MTIYAVKKETSYNGSRPIAFSHLAKKPCVMLWV